VNASGPRCHGLHYHVKWVGYGPEHNQYIPKLDVHALGLLAEYRARVCKPSVKAKPLMLRTILL
jgi:hypothetical protein